MLLQMALFHSFHGWVIFHCRYVPRLLYPFICRWTFRLLPCLGCFKLCCCEHWTHVSFQIRVFIFPRYMPKSEINALIFIWLIPKAKHLTSDISLRISSTLCIGGCISVRGSGIRLEWIWGIPERTCGTLVKDGKLMKLNLEQLRIRGK